MTTRRTYTVPEVAEMLGISRSTAYECVRRGEIPSLKLAGRVVIPRTAFEAFLGEHTPRRRLQRQGHLGRKDSRYETAQSLCRNQPTSIATAARVHRHSGSRDASLKADHANPPTALLSALTHVASRCRPVENALAKQRHELAFDETPKATPERITPLETDAPLPFCTVLSNALLELSNRLLEACHFRAQKPPPRSTQICRLRYAQPAEHQSDATTGQPQGAASVR